MYAKIEKPIDFKNDIDQKLGNGQTGCTTVLTIWPKTLVFMKLPTVLGQKVVDL